MCQPAHRGLPEEPGATLIARSVFVPGKPAPQGSKRHVGNGRMVEASKALRPWRNLIAATARLKGGILPVGPIHAEVDFVMPRPKQTPKRTPPATKRTGDLDKLVRAVFDALTGIWVVDDCLITSLTATKRIAEAGEPSGVHVKLTELGTH